MSKHKEIIFETEIVNHLCQNGWLEGSSTAYNKTLALYPDDLIHYISQTQAQAYAKMQKREGAKTDKVLIN